MNWSKSLSRIKSYQSIIFNLYDFQNSDIRVINCNKLRSLALVILAQGLPQLRQIRVEGPSQLEEIIEHEDEVVSVQKEIILSNFEELTLQNFPSLISLCSKSYHFVFPRAKYLSVSIPQDDDKNNSWLKRYRPLQR